jgi:hypothetical protein
MTGTGTGNARLTVSRRSPQDVKYRQIIVSLDGHQVATLLYGDTYSSDIEPGHHRLRVHNTLVWRTVEFDARPGDDVRFSVVNRTGWGTWWMLSLLGVGPLYVTVEREGGQSP